jgi:signal transduction histidine kinase
MGARRSLRVRLLLAATCSVVAALVLAGFGLTLLFQQHVERSFERELVDHLNQLTAAFELTETGALQVAGPLSDPRFVKPYGGLYWQIEDAAGHALRSRSLWDFSLDLPPDLPSSGELHRHLLAGPAGSELLVIERGVHLGERAFRLAVGIDRHDIDANARDFGWDTTLSLGILAVVLLAAAAAQVSVGLKPLQGLRAELAKVHAGESRRLEASFPSEVQPLVDDLNSLLEQHMGAIERARTQAGNLAHGLKTPLTVLAAERRKLAEHGKSAAAEVLGQQIEAMRRQIDYQLARARAASSSRMPGVASPIGPVVERLVRVLRRVGANPKVELATEIAKEHVFAGEAQDLEEMVGNLLDNACKWARRRVTVASRSSGERVAILVEDDGPGLPAEQREEVFERGRRLDQSVPGSGLGLAIVRDLAEIYGGCVALEDSPEGGLRVRLELPAPANGGVKPKWLEAGKARP